VIRPVKVTVEGTNEEGKPVTLEFDMVNGDSVEMNFDRDFIDRGPVTEIVERHKVSWEYRFFQKNRGTMFPGGIFIKER
jgi:hypothetical protein